MKRIIKKCKKIKNIFHLFFNNIKQRKINNGNITKLFLHFFRNSWSKLKISFTYFHVLEGMKGIIKENVFV